MASERMLRAGVFVRRSGPRTDNPRGVPPAGETSTEGQSAARNASAPPIHGPRETKSPVRGDPASGGREATNASRPGFGAEPRFRLAKQERGGRARRHGRVRERFSDIGVACHSFYDRPIWYEAGAKISEAWVKWIRVNDPFNWFVTLTFKNDVSVELAHRLLDRWLARLAQAVRDKSGHQAPLTCVCATEWTTNRRVHLHLVVKAPGLDEHRRKRWSKTWEGLSALCGMARTHPAARRAAPYLTKYIGKGGLLHVRGRFVGWHPVPATSSAPSSTAQSVSPTSA